MGDKVAADAAACHHQAVDIAGNQSAKRNVVRLWPYALALIGHLLIVFRCECVDIHWDCCPHHRVGLPRARDQSSFVMRYRPLMRRPSRMPICSGVATICTPSHGPPSFRRARTILCNSPRARNVTSVTCAASGIDSIFVIYHEQHQIAIDRKHTGPAITRRHTGACELLAESLWANVLTVVSHPMDQACEGRDVFDHE